MRKPDRFDTLIDGHEDLHQLEGWQKVEIKGLLRRQHAAYVRLVKRLPRWKVDAPPDSEDVGHITDDEGNWLSRDELITALARYRKGAR
jgi:hypothetical protein